MLRHLLPEGPSRGTSLPDSPSSSPSLFSRLPSSCTFRGCLKQWLCPAQTWGGSCTVLPPSSATSSPFCPRGGEGGTGTFFFYTREKRKKSCLSFSGGGLVGSKQWDCSSLPLTHVHARTCARITYTYTFGVTSCPGPMPAGVLFLLGVLGLHLSPSRSGLTLAPQAQPVASTVLPFPPAQAGVVSPGLPFR